MTTLGDLLSLDGPLVEKKGGSWKCECGLFARFVSDRHYYSGWFDCYSYTVACKRCGEVTVDCV